jgi:uncharacterized FlaG/YvyC family protein
MDVPTVAPATTGPSGGVVAPNQEVAAAPQAPAISSGSPGPTQPKSPVNESTIAAAVAKIYNVSSGSSGQPQLAISYKYVSELQLVVTVFTNPQTGEEVAQFPPQELIGLAEFFDQIDGVTLDRKV